MRTRILVIDDDPLNLRMAKYILKDEYEVICAESGPDGLRILRDKEVDLVLLDLHMPEMDGFQVMEKMSLMESVCDVPVLVLTVDNDRETEVKIFKAGAMDYITKPYAPEVVIRRISRVMEWHHCRMSLQKEVDKKTAELRESNRKVTNLSTQVMLALTSAIDAKDKYTKGHSARVAKYSRELARRMGKSAQEMNDICFIALMHDIGKIGIPDSIINKPSRLTCAEYDLMKTHCEIGSDILKNISEFPDLSVGAKWHHERYDGEGYPDGLKGEEIPEIARIICVVNAYDSMASKNRYRDVLTRTKVESEIRRGRGSQFAPVIADHLLAMIREDALIWVQE